jgi:hypothetical protein
LLLALGQQAGAIDGRLDRFKIAAEVTLADTFSQLLANGVALPILGQGGLLGFVGEEIIVKDWGLGLG